MPRAEHPDESWKAHQDINDVMLATAIIPDTFLSVGERRQIGNCMEHLNGDALREIKAGAA